MTKTNTSTACELCKSSEDDEIKYGQLFSDENITVHHYCLLFAPGLPQNGIDDEGFEGFLLPDIRKEIRRIIPLKCKFCSSKRANLGCCNQNCKYAYHMECALNNDIRFEFTSKFETFCKKHKKISQKEKKKLDSKCGICFGKLAKEYPESILIPCCENSWFHKSCLQKYALSAGLLFKCPLCGDKNNCDDLKRLGIFFPHRDALWELQQSTNHEFIEPIELTCESIFCLDKKKHSSEEYMWKLCQFCGSGSVHIKCYFGEKYTCKSCQEFFDKKDDKKSKKSSKKTNYITLPGESDVSSSDEESPKAYTIVKF